LVGNGEGSNKGRVQVFYNGNWLKVTFHSWDKNDGIVACRQLGFAGVLEAGGAGRSYSSKEEERMPRMTRLSCRGNESSLKECKHNITIEYEIDVWRRDAYVICLAGNMKSL